MRRKIPDSVELTVKLLAAPSFSIAAMPRAMAAWRKPAVFVNSRTWYGASAALAVTALETLNAMVAKRLARKTEGMLMAELFITEGCSHEGVFSPRAIIV